MSSVAVAVVGSGYWGKNLVRNFDELGVLHTICDNNPTTLKSFQKKYPDKQFQTSFEAVLENSAIEAVVIATPAETHFELAKRALLAGKHTFVEKPLALVGGEAEELHRLAQDRNLKLMVGHQLHLFKQAQSGKVPHRRKHPVELCPSRHLRHSTSIGRDAHTGHGSGRQLFKQ